MTDKPLNGRTIAVSIGVAPDMEKLGYPDREVDRVLFTVCTALVRAGARVLYAGALDPDGYTFKIFRHLARAYAIRRETAPFIHLVPEPIWREATFESLRSILLELRGIHETLLVARGKPLGTLLPADEMFALRPFGGGPLRRLGPQEFAEFQAGHSANPAATEFSEARTLSAVMSDARVIMGGKMGISSLTKDRYLGKFPGVAEEAIVTLQISKPLIVLGAFGGAARDVAIALGLLPPSHRVSRSPQAESYEQAMNFIAEMKRAVPEVLRGELRELAAMDHADQLARRIVSFLSGSHGLFRIVLIGATPSTQIVAASSRRWRIRRGPKVLRPDLLGVRVL